MSYVLIKYCVVVNVKNFLIDFLGELGNFKQKKITLRIVNFFYILKQRTTNMSQKFLRHLGHKNLLIHKLNSLIFFWLSFNVFSKN